MIDGKGYSDVGIVNGLRVFVAANPEDDLSQALETLKPHIVMVFGLLDSVDAEWQSPGDVVVSTGRYALEPGQPPQAPADWLINRLRAAVDTWEGVSVHFGFIVRTFARVFDPIYESESEDSGLYLAVLNARVDWIVVKAALATADVKWQARLGIGPPSGPERGAVCNSRAGLRAVPEPASAGAAPQRKSNLPTPPAPFWGRQEELQRIADAIGPRSRSWGAMVLGPGGVGKTSLALRAAQLAPVEEFPRKIFLTAGTTLRSAGEGPGQSASAVYEPSL